jgi:hypothetical protein
MLRRDLAFIVSRMMAVIGVFWLCAPLRGIIYDFYVASRFEPPGSNGVLWAIGAEIASATLICGTIYFLWFQADVFGKRMGDRERVLFIDQASFRSTLVFAIGLYFLVGGLVATTGIGINILLKSLPSSMAALVAQRPDLIEVLARVAFGAALLVAAAKPRFLSNLVSLAKGDWAIDYPEDEPSSGKPDAG